MYVTRKKLAGRRLYGFFLLSHPGPVLLHALAVAMLAFVAGRPNPAVSTVLLLTGAHTAMQLTIAMSNDYCDRHLDAKNQPTKPIPRGLVDAHEALTASGLTLVLMIILLAPLPPATWIISGLYLALGMAYNLGLKTTRFSGIVFALAVPLIPAYAFAGMGRSLPLLLVPLGSVLSIALNLANSLPDIETDAKSGSGTLAVVLGVKRTVLLCNLLVAAGAAVVAVQAIPGSTVTAIAEFGTALALLVALLYIGARKQTRSGRMLYFYLVTLACLAILASSLAHA